MDIPRTLKLKIIEKRTHIAASYSADGDMAVYINGELSASNKAIDAFSPVNGRFISLLIGKSRIETRPYGTIRPEGTEKSSTFFDGLLDELKLYDTALSAEYVAAIYKNEKPELAPELPKRYLMIEI